MEINIRDKSELVEIWLTNAEKGDTELREQFKPLYEKYKAKNYLVAVFESGTRDLCDAASDLLCYNRKRGAQLEVEREKRSGMAMGTPSPLTADDDPPGSRADGHGRLAPPPIRPAGQPMGFAPPR